MNALACLYRRHHQCVEISAANLLSARQFKKSIFQPLFFKVKIHSRLIFEINFGLPTLSPEQRRLSNKQITSLNQRFHMAEEEGQQQCPNVTAIHIRVSHDDDTVVAC